MSVTIHNPVLPGFHPDPSIIRVGLDYYLATSTFEWHPGVALYHSQDLAHWRPVGRALDRVSQLDLTAVPDSGGIWAPSLSYCDGKFWLIYTVMRTRTGPYKDMVNALVTADSIEGPWSEPVYLNSRGFDPSLFHDEDGRKWLVQILWDHRQNRPSFGGITLQEYDVSTQRLIGESVRIFGKESLIEGPNIYKRGEFYYLMLAEGGTSWAHAVSMARSRSLSGPYEHDPQPAVLTSRGFPELGLQKAGHGELVETAGGEWYLTHLASRPLKTAHGPRCPLGRETCLQKVVWSEEGWLRLAGGGMSPLVEVPGPQMAPVRAWPEVPSLERFGPCGLGPEWFSLRRPMESSWMDLAIRPGWLRLRGEESPASLHQQSLVARRVPSLRFDAEVKVDFHPSNFLQMAGLICYYDTKTHCYLRISRDVENRRVVGVVTMADGKYHEFPDIVVGDEGEIGLRLQWRGPDLQFYYKIDGSGWHTVGPVLDATEISDDFGTGLHFTGAFVGLCAQDLEFHAATADFSGFALRRL